MLEEARPVSKPIGGLADQCKLLEQHLRLAAPCREAPDRRSIAVLEFSNGCFGFGDCCPEARASLGVTGGGAELTVDGSRGEGIGRARCLEPDSRADVDVVSAVFGALDDRTWDRQRAGWGTGRCRRRLLRCRYLQRGCHALGGWLAGSGLWRGDHRTQRRLSPSATAPQGRAGGISSVGNLCRIDKNPSTIHRTRGDHSAEFCVIVRVFPDDCDPSGMRSVALSAALLVLTVVLVAPAGATAGMAQQSSPQDVSALAGGSLSAPTTTMDVYLQPDQSADWVVSVAYELPNASQQAGFDAVADEFETGSASVGPEASLFRNVASLVGEQTGREMAITNVDYSASRSGSTGELTLSFTWTGFLRSVTTNETQRLIFNDALRISDSETWLATLRANQVLRIHTPRGYAITSANEGFSSNTVEITGPRTFSAEDHIRVIYEESVFGAGAIRFLGVAVIIASLIVGGAILLRRTDRVNVRETVLPGTRESPATADDPPDTGQQTATPDGQPAEPGDQPGDGGPQYPDTAAEEPPDPTLLADDERVERLLDRNDGRMRQADIVDETGWSDAKVSQLLSTMADDDQISKLRIGRENLITLPDVDAVGNDDNGGDDGEGDADTGDADTDDTGADREGDNSTGSDSG